MTVECETNVDAIRNLQRVNLEFGEGPRELLEYEAEALHDLVGSLAYIRADTLFPCSQTVHWIAGTTRVDKPFEGVGHVGVCHTHYNRRCGKFMMVMSLGQFWEFDFLHPKDDIPPVLQQLDEVIIAADLKVSPIQVPILSIREFMVER